MPARPNPQKVLRQTHSLALRAEGRLIDASEKVGRVLDKNLRLTAAEREQYQKEHTALETMATRLSCVTAMPLPSPPRKKALRTGRPSKKELARGAKAKAATGDEK